MAGAWRPEQLASAAEAGAAGRLGTALGPALGAAVGAALGGRGAFPGAGLRPSGARVAGAALALGLEAQALAQGGGTFAEQLYGLRRRRRGEGPAARPLGLRAAVAAATLLVGGPLVREALEKAVEGVARDRRARDTACP